METVLTPPLPSPSSYSPHPNPLPKGEGERVRGKGIRRWKGQRDWHWIDFLCEEAQSTMDRDRKLFAESKRQGRAPILRFYAWKEQVLSYGRTQGIDPETNARFLQEGWKIVKRPTGGGKVFHKNDLCFSLIWRKQDRAIPWGIKDSYCAIHKWVQESLKELGMETDIEQKGETLRQAQGDKTGKALCFESPVENDLMMNGKKIVGGAQWRDGNVALHQGSIQISPHKLDLQVFKQKFSEMFQARFQCSFSS